MPTIDKPGAYNISNEDYQSDPCIKPSLSRSIIKELLFKTPLHAYAENQRLNPLYIPSDDKEKFDIGQAAHSWFVEGTNKISIVQADSWQTKAAREKRDEARAEGLIPLLEKQADSVRQMVDVARIFLNRSELGTIFDGYFPELSYFWKEGETWCRARVDMINKDRDVILDYKTTSGSANPEDFIRSILSFGYDIQEAFYRRGVSAIEGTVPKFIFLVQETTPPYLCSLIGLSPEFKAIAESKVERGIDLWRTCISTDEWPGYPERIAWVDPPTWALSWEMRATFIGDKMEDI